MKIAILGSYSTQFLVIELKKYLKNSTFYEGIYNQIDTEITDENSNLYSFEPDLIIIHETVISFNTSFNQYNGDKTKFFANGIERIERLVLCLKKAIPNVKIIYPTYDLENDMVYGNYFSKVPKSFDYQLHQFNYQLIQFSLHQSNFFLLDINRLALKNNNVRDDRLQIASDLHFSIPFTKIIALHLSKIIKSLNGIFAKCIILDLDNTLWGGTIGDDGLGNIVIGSLGNGNAFSNFQKWLKSLMNRGIILCVCSKNEESLAKLPFEEHPEMILSLNDFAVFIANWKNKVDNIKYIQSVLNIGFDSIIFIDDNPVERDMVKSSIKDIIVPNLPKDPANYLSFLINENLFEMSNFSETDLNRANYYQDENQRKKLKLSSFNQQDYLSSLNMKARVEIISQFNLSRVYQLMQRTNQFNARTIRYDETTILEISKDKNFFTIVSSLNDKFGSNGIVAVIILKLIDKKTLFVDTLLMSCRVFNRGLEYFLFDYILEYMDRNKLSFLMVEWIPTKSNSLVKNFYKSLGFKNFSNVKESIKIDKIKTSKYFIKKGKGNFIG